jgi:hypothetical protein
MQCQFCPKFPGKYKNILFLPHSASDILLQIVLFVSKSAKMVWKHQNYYFRSVSLWAKNVKFVTIWPGKVFFPNTRSQFTVAETLWWLLCISGKRQKCTAWKTALPELQSQKETNFWLQRWICSIKFELTLILIHFLVLTIYFTLLKSPNYYSFR